MRPRASGSHAIGAASIIRHPDLVASGGGRMRKAGWVGAGLCFWLLLPSPAAAQDAATSAAFRQLNDSAIAIYQDAKQRFFAQAGPVLMAGNGGVAIRDRGGVRHFST